MIVNQIVVYESISIELIAFATKHADSSLKTSDVFHGVSLSVISLTGVVIFDRIASV